MAREKKVTMDENAVVKEEKKPVSNEKLTYEQLEQLTAQYYNQGKALKQALEETQNKLNEAISQIEMYQKNEYWMRIDLLWKILTLEGNEEVFSRDFVEQVSKEFASRVFPPVKEKKE